MSRSVGYESDGIAVFMHVECLENWEWDDFLDNLRNLICGRYQSFCDCDRYRGREGHVILENDHAEVIVYEYCGLVSVNIVADKSEYPEISDHWIGQIEKGFRECMNRDFICLSCTGRASNGEAFYEKIKS